MTAWIEAAATDEVGWTHLEELTAIPSRLAGTTGERRAAEATRDVFARVGAGDPRLEEFDLHGWDRGHSELQVIPDGETFDSIALPRSPSEHGTGNLHDVGHGVVEDYDDTAVTDAVVMVDTGTPPSYDRPVHRREKYRLAVKAGATAFVFRNDRAGGLAPTGSVGTESHPIGEIPAVGVSNEVGAQLSRRWSGDRIRVGVEAAIGDATSQNVHATIGPETQERVLFTSHVDAHDIGEGAMDNASGTAMLVTLANVLGKRLDDLETRVEFIGYGGEEVGLVGSKYHAETTERESVKAIVNLDGVVRGRTLKAWTHEFGELDDALQRAADTVDHPVEIVSRAGPPGDQWPLLRWGVPGYFVATVRDGDGRGWGHTAADTLDKLDRRNLREQALVLAELAVELADSGRVIERAGESEIAAVFERAGRDQELRTGDDWPEDWA